MDLAWNKTSKILPAHDKQVLCCRKDLKDKWFFVVLTLVEVSVTYRDMDGEDERWQDEFGDECDPPEYWAEIQEPPA